MNHIVITEAGMKSLLKKNLTTTGFLVKITKKPVVVRFVHGFHVLHPVKYFTM
jgi:hypothetical protein